MSLYGCSSSGVYTVLHWAQYIHALESTQVNGQPQSLCQSMVAFGRTGCSGHQSSAYIWVVEQSISRCNRSAMRVLTTRESVSCSGSAGSINGPSTQLHGLQDAPLKHPIETPKRRQRFGQVCRVNARHQYNAPIRIGGQSVKSREGKLIANTPTVCPIQRLSRQLIERPLVHDPVRSRRSFHTNSDWNAAESRHSPDTFPRDASPVRHAMAQFSVSPTGGRWSNASFVSFLL